MTTISQQNQSGSEKLLGLRENTLLKVLNLVLLERFSSGVLCIYVSVKLHRWQDALCNINRSEEEPDLNTKSVMANLKV